MRSGMMGPLCQEDPLRVRFISTRHAEPLKTVRSKEVDWVSNLDERDPAWKTCPEHGKNTHEI